MVIGVYLYHLLQSQPGGHGLRHRGADQTLGMDCHKVYVLGGGKLGGADQIALILPVGVVDAHDEVSGPQFLQGLLNGGKSHGMYPPLKSVLRQKFHGDAGGLGRLPAQ